MKGIRAIKSQVLSETSVPKEVPKGLTQKEISIILEEKTRIFVVGPGEEKDVFFIRLLRDDFFFTSYFQLKLSLKTLYSINNRFKSLPNVNEVCKYFLSLLEAKNVEIGQKKSDDEIIISFFLPEVPNNIKVDFPFKRESFSLKEYRNQINKGLTEIKRNINEFKLKIGVEVPKEKKVEGGANKKKDKKEATVTYNDLKAEISSLMSIIENLKAEKKLEEKDNSEGGGCESDEGH